LKIVGAHVANAIGTVAEGVAFTCKAGANELATEVNMMPE